VPVINYTAMRLRRWSRIKHKVRRRKGEGFGRVTVETFDADFLVPPTLHDARNAHCVVMITLVDLHLQNRLACLASMQMTGSPILFS